MLISAPVGQFWDSNSSEARPELRRLRSDRDLTSGKRKVSASQVNALVLQVFGAMLYFTSSCRIELDLAKYALAIGVIISLR